MRARKELGVSRLKIRYAAYSRGTYCSNRSASRQCVPSFKFLWPSKTVPFVLSVSNSSLSGAKVQVCDMRRTWPRVRIFKGNVVWLPSALATVSVAGKTFVLFGLRSLLTILKSAVNVNSSGVSDENSARPSAVFLRSARVASSGHAAAGSLGAFAFGGAGAAVRCCAEPTADNIPDSSNAAKPNAPLRNHPFIAASLKKPFARQSYLCWMVWNQAAPKKSRELMRGGGDGCSVSGARTRHTFQIFPRMEYSDGSHSTS